MYCFPAKIVFRCAQLAAIHCLCSLNSDGDRVAPFSCSSSLWHPKRRTDFKCPTSAQANTRIIANFSTLCFQSCIAEQIGEYICRMWGVCWEADRRMWLLYGPFIRSCMDIRISNRKSYVLISPPCMWTVYKMAALVCTAVSTLHCLFVTMIAVNMSIDSSSGSNSQNASQLEIEWLGYAMLNSDLTSFTTFIVMWGVPTGRDIGYLCAYRIRYFLSNSGLPAPGKLIRAIAHK
jgi:hypothetical protein